MSASEIALPLRHREDSGCDMLRLMLPPPKDRAPTSAWLVLGSQAYSSRSWAYGA